MRSKIFYIPCGCALTTLIACGGSSNMQTSAAAPTMPAPPSVVGSTGATAAFTSSYLNGAGCNASFAMTGVEPTSGKHAVFVYVVGTGESPTGKTAMAAVNGMASRGYVSATVAYPDNNFSSCAAAGETAQCIFDGASANSAVSQLCSRDSADCSNGVLVGGFSQGAVIATLAKNFDQRVKAAYAMGLHANYFSLDLTSCMTSGTHALSSSALRVVNGEADVFPGDATLEINRGDAEVVTAFNCGSSTTSCLQANGSGWYIVRNTQVMDGEADHCYMRNGGCGIDELDSGWQNGADAWALNANLDWLAAH